MQKLQWAGGCPGFQLCSTVNVRPSGNLTISEVPLSPADFGVRHRAFFEQSFCFLVPGLLKPQQLQQALQKLVDAFPVIAGRYEPYSQWLDSGGAVQLDV